MRISNWAHILLILFSLFLIGSGRVYSNSVTMNMFRRSKGWLFIDRMSFNKGPVIVKFNVAIETETPPKKQPFVMQLAMIPDDTWEKEEFLKCDAPSDGNGENDPSLDRRQFATRVMKLDLTNENNLSKQVRISHMIAKPTTFHFVLRDCSKNIVNEYFRKETRLVYTLEMKNGDLEHGSDEQSYSYLLPMLLLLTAILTYMSWPTSQQLFDEQKDWAKIVLSGSLLFNLVALLLNWIGHLIYVYASGKQYGFFDFTYLLFHSLSEVMITCLLIFVAFGWTITFIKDAEFDLYIPLISMLGLINLILTLLGKVNDGDSDKYHMYDTIPSYLLVFFRVVTVAILLIGIIKTYSENKGNEKITRFYIRFSILGGCYFLSLPAIMILATWIPVSSRKMIVFICVEMVKNFVNLALTWMVSSKKSMYSSIRANSTSFMEKDNKLL